MAPVYTELRRAAPAPCQGHLRQSRMIMPLDRAIERSLRYLSSQEALASLERDPYWPKWDSPWWHMLLLYELGSAKKIPAAAVGKLTKVLKNHYLPIFPVRAEEVPAGIDPYRRIACHCAVGSAYQLLYACGVDVDKELPWMRPWFLRYQLPDGGLNCDEAAYTRTVPKSSIVSTLPCLEAVLFCRERPLTGEETAFLDKGAAYLAAHGLFRGVSTGKIINQDWLEVRFPRFYDYDFLRGFYFLARWREHSGFHIPPALSEEVAELMSRQLGPEGVTLKRYNLIDKRSYNPDPKGNWAMGGASEFELMKAASYTGRLCQPLTEQWNEVKPENAGRPR